MQSYFRILSAWLNWIVCTYKFYKTIFIYWKNTSDIV